MVGYSCGTQPTALENDSTALAQATATANHDVALKVLNGTCRDPGSHTRPGRPPKQKRGVELKGGGSECPGLISAPSGLRAALGSEGFGRGSAGSKVLSTDEVVAYLGDRYVECEVGAYKGIAHPDGRKDAPPSSSPELAADDSLRPAKATRHA